MKELRIRDKGVIKRFNRKPFRFWGFAYGKGSTQDTAKSLRKRGYNIRITTTSRGIYEVWAWRAD